MPFIQIKVVEGVFTAQQKREIVERITDAMVAIEGESMRQFTWCVVEEIASGEWGIGGQTLTADDFKALARAGSRAMTTAEAHRLPDSVRADGRSASHAARTLYVAASGTLLVLAVFSAFVVTIGDSARSLGAGIAAEAWAFSGMSLGLAAALGSIGQAFPAGAARTQLASGRRGRGGVGH
jgi:4-oxalocrotonate tautomerase